MGLEHRTIVSALREKLARDPNVALHTRARVDALIVESGRVMGVRTHGGHEFRASVVIGADGRSSRLRKLLDLPTQTTLISYTVGATLEGDMLPEPGRGHVVVGAPGPILAYPFGHNRVRMNIDVPLSAPKGRKELIAFVSEGYARFVPSELRPAMLHALAHGPFIACANHAVTTEACAVRGAALVGDAGGCSHPLSATGMTLALHDAETLAEALSTLGPTDAALLAYQQRRYRYVRAREMFAYALYEVFRGATPGARAISEGVFRYWRDPRARRVSMSILSGDETSATTFAAEYARVVGKSGWNAFAGAAREGQLRAAASPVRGVIVTASECLGVALNKAVTTVAAERARELGALGSTPSADRLTRAAKRLLGAPKRRPEPSPEGEPLPRE
jgi:squalene monooxygenase